MRWKAGEALYLSRELESAAAVRQEEHREAHPWEDTIKNFIEREVPYDWDSWDLAHRQLYWNGNAGGDIQTAARTKICIREIWQEALGKDIASLDPQKARAIGGVLSRLDGWERASAVRFGAVYGVQKAFIRTVTEGEKP